MVLAWELRWEQVCRLVSQSRSQPRGSDCQRESRGVTVAHLLADRSLRSWADMIGPASLSDLVLYNHPSRGARSHCTGRRAEDDQLVSALWSRSASPLCLDSASLIPVFVWPTHSEARLSVHSVPLPCRPRSRCPLLFSAGVFVVLCCLI